jgi:hypothetical protein
MLHRRVVVGTKYKYLKQFPSGFLAYRMSLCALNRTCLPIDETALIIDRTLHENIWQMQQQ